MYKYEMTINNEAYNALFADHFEAANFIDSCDSEGDLVIVNGYKEVSIADILVDNDFEWSYRVEMVAIMALPDAAIFHSWREQESELKKLGIIA